MHFPHLSLKTAVGEHKSFKIQILCFFILCRKGRSNDVCSRQPCLNGGSCIQISQMPGYVSHASIIIERPFEFLIQTFETCLYFRMVLFDCDNRKCRNFKRVEVFEYHETHQMHSFNRNVDVRAPASMDPVAKDRVPRWMARFITIHMNASRFKHH